MAIAFTAYPRTFGGDNISSHCTAETPANAREPGTPYRRVQLHRESGQAEYDDAAHVAWKSERDRWTPVCSDHFQSCRLRNVRNCLSRMAYQTKCPKPSSVPAILH